MTQDANERQIVTRSEEMATAADLYGYKDDRDEMWRAIAPVAPWIKPKYGEEMTEQEVALVVRKALAMGLDPLNPHEVQIWKDKRGQINFQIAYTLMTQWVRHFKGEHTEPIYDRLEGPQLVEEGLDQDDVAYRARFIMKEDLANLRTLIDAGYDPRVARKMVEIVGVGVATAEEYEGKYFAPKGRTRAWKVRKRALTDAYRRKFGMPSRPEIVELRRIRGDTQLTLADWKVAGPELPNGERLKIARLNADNRTLEEQLEEMSDEERRALFEKNRALLAGTEEEQAGFEKPAAVKDTSPEEEIIEGKYEEESPLLAALHRAGVTEGADELARAMEHQTKSGKVLGRLERKELSGMLDQILALESPTNKMLELRSHLEVILKHLEHNDAPSAIALIDAWDPPDAEAEDEDEGIDIAQVIHELRISGGWTEEDGDWTRGETDKPDEKLMQRCAAIVGKSVGGDATKRHDLLAIIYGETSTKALNEWETAALTNRWQADPVSYGASEQAIAEAHAILDAHSLFSMFSDNL